MRVAAIDIGSNSLRLLIAEVMPRNGHQSSLRTVARAGESCRLARGLGEGGRISPDMADRAVNIAAEFVERAQDLGAARIVIGATAALRAAGNGEEVARLIEKRTGLPVRILSGEDEAQLVYRSVLAGFGPGADRSPCVVFDLGGGSTEVVSGVGGQPGRWVSLPIGAVTLTERHLKSNPPNQAEIAALEADVRQIIMHGCALLPQRTPLLAGVGGTVTVLALMDRGLQQYDPTQIEGWTIEHDRLASLTDLLVRSDVAERRKWPAMGEGRADIVAAGAMVVRLLAERFPAPSLMCSTQGLRYGLARLAAEELAAGGEASTA